MESALNAITTRSARRLRRRHSHHSILDNERPGHRDSAVSISRIGDSLCSDSIFASPTRGEADARLRAAGEGPNFLKFRIRGATDNRAAKCPSPQPSPHVGRGNQRARNNRAERIGLRPSTSSNRDGVPHLFLGPGAGVTPAEGSVKPTAGFTLDKVIYPSRAHIGGF